MNESTGAGAGGATGSRSSEIRIRPGRPDDAPTIIDFNRRMAIETEGHDLHVELITPGVERVLADPSRGRYLVAEFAESEAAPASARPGVVGQMMITSEWSDWRNGWFHWIQSVYVAPEARKHGVFRALYEHALDAAKRDPDVIGLRLYVEHENHAAQAVYERLGMVKTGYLLFQRCPLDEAVDTAYRG